MIGGLLTEYLSWRWSLLINVPISVIVVTAAHPAAARQPRRGPDALRHRRRLAGTLGLLGSSTAISNAAEDGWEAKATVVPHRDRRRLVLAAFLVWESQARGPAAPARDPARPHPCRRLPHHGRRVRAPDRDDAAHADLPPGPGRAKAPLSAGLHFTPIPVCAIFGALLSMKLLPRVPPRLIIAGRLAARGRGPGEPHPGRTRRDLRRRTCCRASCCSGSAPRSCSWRATRSRSPACPDRDTGLASAVINTMQQVGAALGVAILSTVAANASSDYVAEHGPASAAAGHRPRERHRVRAGGGPAAGSRPDIRTSHPRRRTRSRTECGGTRGCRSSCVQATGRCSNGRSLDQQPGHEGRPPWATAPLTELMQKAMLTSSSSSSWPSSPCCSYRRWSCSCEHRTRQRPCR